VGAAKGHRNPTSVDAYGRYKVKRQEGQFVVVDTENHDGIVGRFDARQRARRHARGLNRPQP
jgi:hypothetical protein